MKIIFTLLANDVFRGQSRDPLEILVRRFLDNCLLIVFMAKSALVSQFDLRTARLLLELSELPGKKSVSNVAR